MFDLLAHHEELFRPRFGADLSATDQMAGVTGDRPARDRGPAQAGTGAATPADGTTPNAPADGTGGRVYGPTGDDEPLPQPLVPHRTIETVQAQPPLVADPAVVAVTDPLPIEVPAPSAAPLLGLLPIDVSAVEADAQALLSRVTGLQADLADEFVGTDDLAWLAGVLVATGGVTQAVRVHRARGRVGPLPPGSDSVLGRWGADHGADG
ncbi:MAG TPA: hypothetical protein VH092_23830 [Urbifossiella sp.]|nr:hypothetical protein [Urbifossiella sp.]